MNNTLPHPEDAKTSQSKRSGPRWVGGFVIWWGGEDWEWRTCVACERPLQSRLARANGYCPGCGVRVAATIEKLVEERRRTERARALEETRRGDAARPHNRAARHRAKVTRRSVVAATAPPTPAQMTLSRALAAKTGITFEQPKTRAHAAAQIDALLARKKKTK